MNCKFTRYYEEPNEKYVCLSLSLFLVEKYIKRTKKNESINVLDKKINLFFKNMIQKSKNLLDGTFPNNYYMRIYYDDSIYKNDKMKLLFDKFKKHQKIQLIQYECPKYKKNDISHIHLFGTVMRFHALFDKYSPNMEMCAFIDADAYYTKNYIRELEDFRKSNYLILTFNTIYQTPMYFMDEKINPYNYNLLDKTHFPAGLTTIKRNPIFDSLYWDKYLENMFDQFDLLLSYNYLDFKRFGLKNENDYEKQSYYSFNYGFDEIWLSFILKKILIDSNNQNKLKVILFRSTNIINFLNRILLFFQYNYNRNFDQFNLFIKNCDFLENKSIEGLEKYMKNIKNENIANSFFIKLKNNPYFNRIYLQNNIKFIIFNYDQLYKIYIKYHQDDLIKE
jgi:hypothetical protein